MRCKAGFNLIEIAIVLAVIGLVIGGIYTAASAVTARNRIQVTESQFVTIMHNVNALFASQPAFTYMDHATVKATGIMPANVPDNGTDFLNVYGGTISIGDSSNNGAQGWSLEYNGIPTDACIRLMTDMVTSGSKSIFAVQINTNYLVFNNNLPLTTIVDQCGAQAKNYLGINVLLH